MNRRHKAILFVTLVLTGSALLAGATVTQGLGILILGAALAWAVGSDLTFRAYLSLKGIRSGVAQWIRLPLVMTLAGTILGTVLLLSHWNPVIAMSVMCFVGIVIAPFTSVPTQKNWLKATLWLLGVIAYSAAILATVVAFYTPTPDNAEMDGGLAVTGLAALIIGVLWLSKGWQLIQDGISAPATSETASHEMPRKSVIGHYFSLCAGVTVLTLWLGLLTWNASGDWAYGPQSVTPSKKSENWMMLFALPVVLALWPYSSWRKILLQERHSNPTYLRRHQATTALAGVVFTVVICLAATFGIQNGQDRLMTSQITGTAAELRSVATTLRSLKEQDLTTAADYIRAYSEVERLQPEFDAKIRQFDDVGRRARLRDESRGPINIQRLYGNPPESWQQYAEMAGFLRQESELTKRETDAIRKMATLPEQDQVDFWRKEFQPVIKEELALRDKMIALQSKMQSRKTGK